jgi:hypothetical protein
MSVVAVATGLLVALPVSSSAANPQEGNQCTKKQLGTFVGSLTCSQVGGKYVWVRTATSNPDADGCDPNYEPCVPIASDVDCAGGKGNGPAYVQGPVNVIGTDVYGLDADDDGIGCEPPKKRRKGS